MLPAKLLLIGTVQLVSNIMKTSTNCLQGIQYANQVAFHSVMGREIMFLHCNGNVKNLTARVGNEIN